MADKIFTVDKFLGLNEAVDGTTELKMGEAAKMENFTITDGYNLKSRPGISRYADAGGTGYLKAWTFFSGEYEYLAAVRDVSTDAYDRQELRIFRNGELVLSRTERAFYNVFPYNGKMCVLYWDEETPGYGDSGYPKDVNAMYFVSKADGSLEVPYMEGPYYPLVVSGSNPAGGGTKLEAMNLLSRYFREGFTADGTSADYVLTGFSDDVFDITVDGTHHYKPFSGFGTYHADTHTFTFQSPPEKDADIVFYCETDDADLRRARNRLLGMPYIELFNGATDTRTFFYGDGSNLCYYTGVPANGTGVYIPAGNELTVDFSNSPVTGLVRHYSRLLAFKPDGVDAISYEPVTLADGSVIAGFYLRPVSREYGNEALGQVALVNNYARTFSQGSIYEWRISSSSYRDERYSKCVSQRVSKSIAKADMSKVVACDDDRTKTYYVFLNDQEGTVLVNRYDLEVWSIYRSALAVGVTHAFSFEGKVLFLRGGELFAFDSESTFDAPVEEGGQIQPIHCIWESGYMAFGADFKRKYSSNLWVSMLPEGNSRMEITVQTDRRDEYLEKVTGLPLLDFTCMDFSNFSFLRSLAPKIKRIKIKVKKFVYYKLIFRVTQAGARATVLGYDQQVRYSSNVK